MKRFHFLVLLAIAGILSIGCQESYAQTTTTAAAPSPDGFIPKEMANRMIQSYLKSVANTPAAEGQDAYSFLMDAEELRTYLANTNIKGIKIMLAHTMDYINSGKEGIPAGYKAGALTIVIAGYDANGNYVYAPGQKVPDTVKPNPPYSTGTGNAENPLLP